MKTLVKFLKPKWVYNPGEVAGFAPDVAERLVAEGVAKKLAEGVK